MRTTWDKCTSVLCVFIDYKNYVGQKAISELYGLDCVCFLTLKKR